MNRMTIQNAWVKNRKLLFCATACLFLLYFACAPLNYYLTKSIYEGAFFRMGIPLLTGAYLAVRGFRDGKEVGILVLYWCWITVSRILNGDPTLTSSLTRILELLLMVLLFVPGVMLPRKERALLYDVNAIVITVLHFILGCLAVYVAVSGKVFLNPIDDRLICFLHDQFNPEDRLYMLDLHPNAVAGRYLISFCLLCVLFLRHRNILFRIWAVAAAVLDVVVVALTISRNGQTFLALSLALATGILLVRRLRDKKLPVRIAALLVALVIVTPLFYQVYEPIRYGLWALSPAGRAGEQSQQVESAEPAEIIEASEIAEPAESGDQTAATGAQSEQVEPTEITEVMEALYSDPATGEYEKDSRDYLRSGRTEIYRSALVSIKKEPQRLLIGSSYDTYMDISHDTIWEPAHNFHNLILEVLNLFGLPGLALVVYFYICLAKRGLRLIFDSENRFSPAQQLTVLPTLALTGYYMLEAGIFTDMDFRVAFFFFACGMMAGSAQIPEREKTA